LHIDLVVACGTIPPSLVQHDMLIGFERSETDIKARSDGENRVMKDYLREYSLCLPFSFLRDAASHTSSASDGLLSMPSVRIIFRCEGVGKRPWSPGRRRKPYE
jgi:hypothetical protein